MNDFTIEELKLLRTCLTQTLCNVHYPLEDKLTSMIDEYCEHECNGEIEIFLDTCKKCNAYLLRETHL